MNPGGRPQLAVGAVVLRDDDLLLVRRGTSPHAGLWTLPGGRVERGELLAEAVIRELREETGVVGVCSGQVGVAELLPQSPAGTEDEHSADQHSADQHSADQHYVVIDFMVTLLDSHQEPTAGSDATDARWVPVWDVAEMELTPGLAEFLSAHDIIDTIA